MKTVAHTFIEQAQKMGGDMNRQSRYARAVGEAVNVLFREKAGLTRKQFEQSRGFQLGTLTLIMNGHTTGVVSPPHWFSVLETIGMTNAAEFMGGSDNFQERFPRLLGDLVILQAFENEGRFETMLRQLGLGWKDLPEMFRQWGENVFTPTSRKILSTILDIDVDRDENGDAFCDFLSDYDRMTGRDFDPTDMSDFDVDTDFATNLQEALRGNTFDETPA